MTQVKIEVPEACARGVHDWDKDALVNGHHMCTRCPLWLERPSSGNHESVQKIINDLKKLVKKNARA